MKYLAIILACLLASCSKSEPPSVAPLPALKATPAPAALPPPPPPQAPAESAAKEVMELPSKKVVPLAPSRDPEPRPSAKRPKEPPPADVVYLPSFTIRNIRGSGSRVLVNGEEYGTTPCLWSIHEAMEFDPKIPVPVWPPPTATFVGRSQSQDEPRQQAEVYLEKRSPDSNEYVVYIKGKAGFTNLLDALRLEVVGNSYTVYTPLVDPEGDLASRYLRTLWFDGTP